MEEAQLNLNLGVADPVTMEELESSLDVYKDTIEKGSKRIVESALNSLQNKALKELMATWKQEAEESRRSADFLRTMCSKKDTDDPREKDMLAAAKEAMTAYLLKRRMIEVLEENIPGKVAIDVKRRNGESLQEYHERLVMYLKSIQNGEDLGITAKDVEEHLNKLKQSQSVWTRLR